MLRMRLLGTFEVEWDGAPVEPPSSRRAWALLAWLALHPGTHARAEVAAAFWPDVLDTSARASLRSALWSLRRALGPTAGAAVRVGRDRVGLDADRGALWVDAVEFERLVAAGRLDEAAAMASGELLTGFEEDWATDAREEHRARLARVLDRLAAAAQERDDTAADLLWIRRLARLDPLAEEPQRRLMELLAATGDHAAALAGYARYRRRLERELGVRPSPALRRLAATLERTAAGTSRPTPGYERMPPMVGREAELERLLDAWQAARDGRGGVVTISGEAGMGKTRLAVELLERARAAGARTASCAALDLGGAPPLGLWAELIGELCREMEAPPPDASWPSVLTPIAPDLEHRLGREPRPRPGVSPDLERARLFEATVALLEWAGRRPTVLLLEDVQLADAASLDLTAYVGRRAAGLPLLMVLTRRPLPHRAQVDTLEHALRARAALVAELVLRPLPPDAVIRMIRAEGTLPADRIEQVVAAAGALECGLLQTAHGRIGYRHALLREAAYRDLPEPQRARLHEDFAASLAARDTGDGRLAAETAHHLRLAHRGDLAVPHLVRAAAHARAVASLAEAEAFLEEAARIAPSDASLLVELAEVRAWRGDPESSEEAFTRARELLDPRDPELLAQALTRRADWYRGALCHPRQVLDSARGAIEVLDAAQLAVPQLRTRALAAWAWAEAVAGDADVADHLLVQVHALSASQPDGDLLTHWVGHARAFALVRRGRFTESYAPQIAAAAAADRAGRPDLGYGCWVNAACAAACAGDFERALEFVDRGTAALAGSGLATLEVHFLAARAHVLTRMGRLAEARAASEAEGRLADRLQSPALQATSDHDRGLVALALGDFAYAQRLLTAALDHRAPVSRPLARLALAEALARLGRCEQATAQLRLTALEPVGPSDLPEALVPRLTRVQGLIAAEEGDLALAVRRLEEAAAGWRRLVDRAGSGDRYSAALADFGRPPVAGLVEPARELERVLDELAALQRAPA